MRRMLASLIFLPLLSALSHNHPLTGFVAVRELHPCSQALIVSSVSFYLKKWAVFTLTHRKRCQGGDKKNDFACLKVIFCFFLSYFSSELVTKKDHKSAFFIAVSGAPNRTVFTEQLKVRIEFITIVFQKGNWSQESLFEDYIRWIS